MAPISSTEVVCAPAASPFQEFLEGAKQGFWNGVSELLRAGGGALKAVDELAKRGWEKELLVSLQSACWPQIFEEFRNRDLIEAAAILMVGHMMGLLYVGYVWVYLPTAGFSILSANSIVFHCAFAASLVSYYQCIVVHPGHVPEGFDPNLPGMVCYEKKRTSPDFRWCNKERVYKPDRAHFCSALGRNVLRMDHYCPWISNCVGYFNHKQFLLFLFYTVVATNMFSYQVGGALLHGGLAPAGYTFMMTEGEIIAVALSGVITPFFVWQSWLLSRNMTTIEFCERMGADSSYKSRYDVGLYRNLKSVFGKNPWLWLSPLHPIVGNGIEWERSIENYSPENTPRQVGDYAMDGDSPERTEQIPRQKKECIANLNDSQECLTGFLGDLVRYSCLYNDTMIDMWRRTNRICGFSWA